MPSTFTAVSYGQTLSPKTLASVKTILAEHGYTVAVERMESHSGFEAAIFELGALEPSGTTEAQGAARIARLRAALAEASQEGISTAIVPDSLRAAKRKFIIMDVDSTLIQQEVIELLAAHAGTEAEVTRVTEAAMRGELDFEQSLHHRVATLAGLPESVLADVGHKIKLSVGAQRLVAEAKAAGHVVCAVSGGFSQILTPLAESLGLDHALANDLEIVDGYLTGKVSGAVVDRAAKAVQLRAWSAEAAIPGQATMAIGDGANDLDMMAAAALGVAFNAKPAVRAAADAQINIANLDVALVLANI
ncbi:phosphoserine phosphatase SerB [Arthrobacter psychrochitiniphilus]|uniref:phosphoserine phosphatase n=1 Tax=Arthrobacter psychrochitiniphilus TaxID=291045 RepID=A0A2V3DRE5_9MICC|nr:phosphoserine phosphatase SerB [Arthrobacter psychrochitiniphilus]NYG17094.1 phosphoserine phosphatase [Arthrobacter psychrochitiniphilus]PXA65591.1 phosphoserine phosphatase SerB [Arthrobacter psychrochitiniphilus]